MSSSLRFVLKPYFNNLSEQWLHYQDILTYVTIRSFHNNDDKYCYPSYKTIKERSGLSKKFIAKSVYRLHKAKLLQVWRVGKNRVQHYYRFPEDQQLLKIPFEIFNQAELTGNQKALLMLVHEHCDSLLNCYLSNAEIAEKCGLSIITINNLLRLLIGKRFLAYDLYEDPLTDSAVKVLKLTDKVKWPSQIVLTTASLKADVARMPEGMDIVNMFTKMFKKTRSGGIKN